MYVDTKGRDTVFLGSLIIANNNNYYYYNKNQFTNLSQCL